MNGCRIFATAINCIDGRVQMPILFQILLGKMRDRDAMITANSRGNIKEKL